MVTPSQPPIPTNQEIVGADINWSSRQAKAAAKSAVKHITVASAERKPEEAGKIQGFSLLGSGWILVDPGGTESTLWSICMWAP